MTGPAASGGATDGERVRRSIAEGEAWIASGAPLVTLDEALAKPVASQADGELRDRELIARHLRAAASAVNITDWPAYLNRVADLHETGEAWYQP